MTHSLELTRLREDNPRDFLAALGLLRMLDVRWPSIQTKLSWNPQTGTPAITSAQPLDINFPQHLWDLLRELKIRDLPPLEPVAVEAVSAADFRNKIKNAIDINGKFEVMLLTAMASQIEMEKASRRSDFIIESGQRRVMKGVCDMLADEDFGPSLFSEITGQANPVKVSNSSRWNPAEFRSAAYTTTDPAKTDFLDHPGLNVIAFIGLTFYPVVDSLNNKSTPGFARIGGKNQFSWPVWSEPVTPDETTSLLHHSEVHAREINHRLLQKLGIHRVWRTRKFGDANNKYFSTAMPA